MNIANILNRKLGLVTVQNLQRVFNFFSSSLGLVDGAIPDSRPYKVYTALFYLNGTDPVVTELENTLGDEITWTFGNDGFFTLTPTAIPFDNLSTFTSVQTNADDNETPTISYTYVVGGTIILYTFDLAAAPKTGAIGAEVFPCKVEIRVYN